MSDTSQKLNAVTLFVADLARTKAFYCDGFGWSIAWEDPHSVGFDAGGCFVNFLIESEAPDLIAPASVAAAGTGQRFMLSIFVPDTDAALTGLAERGIEPISGPIDRPWGMRTACVLDPDGYVWELAQQIG